MATNTFFKKARDWCNCGNETPNSNSIVDQSECNMACPGNSNEICGGEWRMNVYTIRSTNKGRFQGFSIISEIIFHY